MFYFHPSLGKWSNLTNIFSNGLVQSPTSYLWTGLQDSFHQQYHHLSSMKGPRRSGFCWSGTLAHGSVRFYVWRLDNGWEVFSFKVGPLLYQPYKWSYNIWGPYKWPYKLMEFSRGYCTQVSLELQPNLRLVLLGPTFLEPKDDFLELKRTLSSLDISQGRTKPEGFSIWNHQKTYKNKTPLSCQEVLVWLNAQGC